MFELSLEVVHVALVVWVGAFSPKEVVPVSCPIWFHWVRVLDLVAVPAAVQVVAPDPMMENARSHNGCLPVRCGDHHSNFCESVGPAQHMSIASVTFE